MGPVSCLLGLGRESPCFLFAGIQGLRWLVRRHGLVSMVPGGASSPVASTLMCNQSHVSPYAPHPLPPRGAWP